MSSLNISLTLDGAAFEGDQLGKEVARILATVASRVEWQSRADLAKLGMPLRDVNGNTVGALDFDIDPDELVVLQNKDLERLGFEELTQILQDADVLVYDHGETLSGLRVTVDHLITCGKLNADALTPYLRGQ